MRLPTGLLVTGRTVGGLDQLEVVGAEVVADELVDERQRLADAVLGEEVFQLDGRLVEHLAHPVARQARGLGLRSYDGVCRPALDEAEGVPELVAEVASLLAEALIEEDVVARRRAHDEPHTHAVGAVLID